MLRRRRVQLLVLVVAEGLHPDAYLSRQDLFCVSAQRWRGADRDIRCCSSARTFGHPKCIWLLRHSAVASVCMTACFCVLSRCLPLPLSASARAVSSAGACRAWDICLPEPCAAFATLNLELTPFRPLQSVLYGARVAWQRGACQFGAHGGCCLADNPHHRVRSGTLPRRTVLLTYGVCRHGRDATKCAPTSTVSASDSQSSRASGCACNLTGAAWRRGSTSAIGTQFHISVRWPYAAGTRWEDFWEWSTIYGSQYLAAVASPAQRQRISLL